MEENDLYTKPERYKWKVREVDFLGVVIGPEKIKMKEVKVKAVLEQLVSKSIKNVQKFLELANYYRRFVKDFSKIARLLHKLTRKEQKWEWGIRQEKSFEVLKKWFTREPILVAPDLDRKMRMEVDVSDYAIVGDCQQSVRMDSRGWQHTSQNLSIRQRGIIRFMTRRCQQLLEDYKIGDIYQKILNLSSRFRQTISNIHKSNSSANRVKYKDKAAEIVKLSSLILARLPKKVLEKLKLFKNEKKLVETVKLNNKQSYAQAVNSKVTDILKSKISKFSSKKYL